MRALEGKVEDHTHSSSYAVVDAQVEEQKREASRYAALLDMFDPIETERAKAPEKG